MKQKQRKINNYWIEKLPTTEQSLNEIKQLKLNNKIDKKRK